MLWYDKTKSIHAHMTGMRSMCTTLDHGSERADILLSIVGTMASCVNDCQEGQAVAASLHGNLQALHDPTC
jgi:hypothetical protein